MKLDLSHVSKKLAHLSADQITNLCVRYFNEKVKDLIEEYQIDLKSQGLSLILPPRILPDELCPYCDIPLRQKLSKGASCDKHPYCISCKHKKVAYCHCEGCEEKESQQRIEKRKKINKLWEDEYGKPDKIWNLNDIPLKAHLYLTTFLRATTCNQLFTNFWFEDFSTKITPNQYFTNELIEYLLKNSYIKRNLTTYGSYSYFTPDEEMARKNLLSNQYELLIESDELNTEEIYNCLYFPKIKKEEEKDLRELWAEIAKAECLEYVSYKIEDIGIHYKYCQKHLMHIEKILNNFSVSQFYCMFFSKLKSAHYSRTSKGLNPIQVLNSSVYGALTYSERAVVGNWPVAKYNREYQCEQSIVSEVFFSLFLPIDKAGFHECPATFKIDTNN